MDWLSNLVAVDMSDGASMARLMGVVAAAAVAVASASVLIGRALAGTREPSVSAVEGLISVLLRARALLARPGNDFAWSSWEDAEAALKEVDSLIADLRAGKRPDPTEMWVLFAPTGPVQEVSLSSGWGEEFLAISSQFDRAHARYARTETGMPAR